MTKSDIGGRVADRIGLSQSGAGNVLNEAVETRSSAADRLEHG